MSVELSTLSNGLRVVTERMDGLNSAAVGIWVRSGARHERPEQNGMAHFLEHMAFKGTKTRSALDIAETIENVGGYINAYTSREMTAYYTRVLDGDVALACDVLSDIVLHSVLDPKEIEVERSVILQEIGQCLDTPDDIIFDWLQETAYPDQAMGRSILGPSHLIERFTKKDLSDFIKERYSPNEMILAAAGAVDHGALLRQAETLFSGVKAKKVAAEKPSKYHSGIRREEKPLEQAHLALGIEAPSYREDAMYHAQITSMILGGGMSSRLFQEAREKKGLCYTIFANMGAFSDSGMMTIYAGTGGSQVKGLTELIIDEIKRASTTISEGELNRARAQLKAGLLMGLESPSARVERLARMVSIWDRVPDLAETIDKIDMVKSADLTNFCEGIMTKGQIAATFYGPVKDAPDLDEIHQRLAS